MAILACAAWPHEVSNGPVLNTTAGTYDSSYAPGSLPTPADLSQSFGVVVPTPATDLWFHARVKFPKVVTGTPSGDCALLRTEHTAGSNTPIIDSSTGGNIAVFGTNVSSGLFPWETLADLDVKTAVSGSNRTVEVYINGALVAGFTKTGQNNNPVSSFTLCNIYRIYGQVPAYFSEIIVADESTLGWRLHSKRPDGTKPGLNTFATGTWGLLADDNVATGLTDSTVGKRATGEYLAYTGPATPMGIRGVALNTRMIRTPGSPQLSHQLRISGTNYDTPSKEERLAYQVFSSWDQNPATAANWAVADFTGLQGGIRTVTP